MYHIAIASEFEGKAAVGDQIHHTVVPILAVVGWPVFGPRGLASQTDALRAVLVPFAWLVFTLVGPAGPWGLAVAEPVAFGAAAR